MPKLKRGALREWIKAVTEKHGLQAGDISYIFCSDKRILEVNKQFCNTTIIPTSSPERRHRRQKISGDLFISLDTVKSNPEQLGSTEYDNGTTPRYYTWYTALCAVSTTKDPGEREVMEANENEVWPCAQARNRMIYFRLLTSQ